MPIYTNTLLADTLQETALRLRAKGIACRFRRRDRVLYIQAFFTGLRFLLAERGGKLHLHAGFLSGFQKKARVFKDVVFRCSHPQEAAERCLMVVEKVRILEEELRKTAVETY
jgi:hypothetical protein